MSRLGKRQKLTQLLPKSGSAVLGLHTNACPGALDDGAGSFDSLMLEAHVVALLQVHRGRGGDVGAVGEGAVPLAPLLSLPNLDFLNGGDTDFGL